MRTAPHNRTAPPRSHRPRAITVFAAAFLAGAAAAVVVNRVLDVRLAQAKPRVESETIFVALRSLPQGAPVTVWDVALREWPKAMMPATALHASDSFSGLVLKHPLREGQPLLSIQLVRAEPGAQRPGGGPPAQPPAGTIQTTEADLWSPAQPASTAATTPSAPTQTPFVPVSTPMPQAAALPPVVAAPVAEPVVAAPVVPQAAPTPAVTSDQTAVVAVPPASTVSATPPAAPPEASAALTDSDVAVTTSDIATTAPTATAVAAAPAAVNETAPMQPADAATAREPLVAITDSDVADADVGGPATAEDATPTVPQPAPTETAATAAGNTAEMTPEQTQQTPTDNTPTPEPTADVVVENPAAGQQPAPVAQSVVVPPQIPAPQPTERPSSTQARYLVVPESIAVQADASFTVRPPVEQPVAATPAPRQLQPPRAAQSADPVRPLPTTETARRNQRTATPQGGNTQGRQPSRTGRQPAPADQSGTQSSSQSSGFGTMFPNISAGIGAIEGEFGRIRRDRAAQADTPATARPRPQY